MMCVSELCQCSVLQDLSFHDMCQQVLSVCYVQLYCSKIDSLLPEEDK